MRRKAISIILLFVFVFSFSMAAWAEDEVANEKPGMQAEDLKEEATVKAQSIEEDPIETIEEDQTISYASRENVIIGGSPDIVITRKLNGSVLHLQKQSGASWTSYSKRELKAGENICSFNYPYNTTSSKWRLLIVSDEKEEVYANIDLTVKNPSVAISLSKADKNQWIQNTRDSYRYYPINLNVKKNGTSTIKNIKKTAKITYGNNYNIKWDAKHKTTSFLFKANRYRNQRLIIKDSCRHRTWDSDKKSKTFTKTVNQTKNQIKYTFGPKLLPYENHVVTITAQVKTDRGYVNAGSRKFHVHVIDKGEQIIDTGARFLGLVTYSGAQRTSISRTGSLSFIQSNTPSKCCADCSSYTSWIYHLHGLWSGTGKYNNFTRTMGPNSPYCPKTVKRGIKKCYKNMGCVWLVADGESDHQYAHAALMVGDNYYLNVTAHKHDKYSLKYNACFQKCTPGSRNYAVPEVYNYRSY